MYTYDDYLKKKQEYGFGDGDISDADERIAQANPDAGISLLTYKNDWNTAATDSARAFAHGAAEDIRKRYGGYTGGADGGSFALTGVTPQYENAYKDAIDAQLGKLNREFSYDPATDPNTKYYTDMYRREGQRAMRDTLGSLSSATGGNPSSYAAAAAAQANNYYAQQLTDKYTELYQQAYENFLSEYSRAYQTAGAYQQQEQTEYQKYIDRLNLQYQEEQAKAAAEQQAFENEYLMRQYEDELALNLRQLDLSERQAAQEIAYKYAALAQSGREADAELAYRYEALSEEAQRAVDAYAQEMAVLGAKYGDLSGLAELGIDTTMYQRLLDEQMGVTEEAARSGDETVIYTEDGTPVLTGNKDEEDFAQQRGVPTVNVTPSTLADARFEEYYKDKPYTDKYAYLSAVEAEVNKALQAEADEERYQQIVERLQKGETLSDEDRTFYFLYRDKMMNSTEQIRKKSTKEETE